MLVLMVVVFDECVDLLAPDRRAGSGFQQDAILQGLWQITLNCSIGADVPQQGAGYSLPTDLDVMRFPVSGLPSGQFQSVNPVTQSPGKPLDDL